MIGWLSRRNRDKQRKETRSKKLREELAAKVQELDSNVRQSVEDFTDLTINGVRKKVATDRMTLVDASAYTVDATDLTADSTYFTVEIEN